MNKTLIVKTFQILPLFMTAVSFQWIFEKLQKIGDADIVFLFWIGVAINFVCGSTLGLSGVERFVETDTRKREHHSKRQLVAMIGSLIIVFIAAVAIKHNVKGYLRILVLAYGGGVFSSFVIAEPEKLITMWNYRPERKIDV